MRNTPALSEDARRFLSQDKDLVPSWVPADERRDWTPSADVELQVDFDDDDDDDEALPESDPCADGDAENRWVGSLRNLSQLGTLTARREKPAIRGSVLEIRPPSVRERLGVHGRRRRGWDYRSDKEHGKEERADEYVGFLLKGEMRKEKRSRKATSWLRFFRRSL